MSRNKEGKIFVCGTEYEVLDVMENITIADSFIKGGNKIGTGHGEAKLYVGQITDNQTIQFFNIQNPNNTINCFILKRDLIQYLYDTASEYKNPTQLYQSLAMPSLWQERVNSVNTKEDFLPFKLRYLNELQPPRIYLNSIDSRDENYALIREIPLPNLSYLSCLKLRNLVDNSILFYFKIFANLDFLQKDTTAQESYGTIVQTTRAGQTAYRLALLRECPFCPITMVNYDRLLIASHIKPFAKCTPDEQYDPKNGLMLTPTIDKLFDKGFITFSDDKQIILSPWISSYTFSCLNLKTGARYPALPFDNQRLLYMKYHRDCVFKD